MQWSLGTVGVIAFLLEKLGHLLLSGQLFQILGFLRQKQLLLTFYFL